jgi:hypothetical protein
MGLVVVFEKKDSVVLAGKILKFVPLAGFEALQTLVLSVFLSQELLGSVLHFVLELQLVLFTNLHLESFGFLFLFVFMVGLFLFPILLVLILDLLLSHLLFMFLYGLGLNVFVL